jgi:hypothetical protein
VVAKARALYRRRAGMLGRLVAGWPPLFDLAMRSGWISVR